MLFSQIVAPTLTGLRWNTGQGETEHIRHPTHDHHRCFVHLDILLKDCPFRCFIQVPLNNLRVCSSHASLLRCLKIRVHLGGSGIGTDASLTSSITGAGGIEIGIGSGGIRCLKILVHTDWILGNVMRDTVFQMCVWSSSSRSVFCASKAPLISSRSVFFA